MTATVFDLQREALDKSIRASDLLQKALSLARELRATEIESWALSELNGYPESAKVPDYRRLSGEIGTWNPDRGTWLPVVLAFDPENALTRRACAQPVAEIETLASRANGGRIALPYPAEVQARIVAVTRLPSVPFLLVSESQLHALLDAIRAAVLDWALQLEERGIQGD
jgi:hypothetical protein